MKVTYGDCTGCGTSWAQCQAEWDRDQAYCCLNHHHPRKVEE